jgi:two-component SAPR family response regulator
MVQNRLNIYIIDDNIIMTASLRHMLTRMGHSICGSAVTCKKAVHELQQMDVDLVITDTMLACENGINLPRFIKTNLNIPFIYQSSDIENEDIATDPDTQPDAYLLKPVSKPALTEVMMNFNTNRKKKSFNFGTPQ